MNIVNGITTQASQVLGLILEDGSRATITLYFRPQQNGWFYSVEWPGSSTILTPFNSYNRRLVTSANMLRQERNIIPFGLACFTPDNSDPMTQNCFADGSAVLVLLSPADVEEVEDSVYSPP